MRNKSHNQTKYQLKGLWYICTENNAKYNLPSHMVPIFYYITIWERTAGDFKISEVIDWIGSEFIRCPSMICIDEYKWKNIIFNI